MSICTVPPPATLCVPTRYSDSNELKTLPPAVELKDVVTLLKLSRWSLGEY